MFKENINQFLSVKDFGEYVTYSNGNIQLGFPAIINTDVALTDSVDSYIATTFSFESNDNVIIGGIIRYMNDNYKIDNVITDDGRIKVVSAAIV